MILGKLPENIFLVCASNTSYLPISHKNLPEGNWIRINKFDSINLKKQFVCVAKEFAKLRTFRAIAPYPSLICA